MSTEDPETAYQNAEAELRAFYTETTAKYRAARRGACPPQEAAAGRRPEWVWTESDQKTLSELRDKAADAALALLQARGWFRNVSTAP